MRQDALYLILLYRFEMIQWIVFIGERTIKLLDYTVVLLLI